MLAAARIGVFIQGRAVETRQAVGILGKVGRYPVQQYADPVLMAHIHEIAKVIGLIRSGWSARNTRSSGNPRTGRRDAP